MKRSITITSLLIAALTTGVGAQSAESFQAPGSTAEVVDVAAEERNEALDKETESALLAAPSRYAGLDLENYIQALSSSFSMRTRDVDPFARHQDPSYKPYVPTIRKPKGPKAPKEPETPFSDIVARITVTAVMPAQQTFLVGQRSFTIGDRIKLNVGKPKLLSVHVVAINTNSVTFRHGVTAETADVVLNIMPAGMRRGAEEQHPPGFTPLNKDAPLDVRPSDKLSSRR